MTNLEETDDAQQRSAMIQDPPAHATGPAQGGWIELSSIHKHDGFRRVSQIDELLSIETADPLLHWLDDAGQIGPASSPLIAGETVFGMNLPDSILDARPYRPRPVTTVRFSDCRLYPEWGVVMSSVGAVYEPTAHVARWKSPDLTQLAGVTLSGGKPGMLVEQLPQKRYEGTFLILNHWGSRNYGHFLFDCVPGVMLFLEEIRQGELKIITQPLSAWQQEILVLLGVPAECVQQDSLDSFICERLLWPSFLQGNLTFPAAFTSRVADHLRGSVISNGAGPGPQLIYISRANYPNRIMNNEADLIKALEELGFSVIRPEDYTVAQQISLFSGATIVVGEVGAALANLMFAPAGCKVIEIMPEIKESLWIKRWCMLRNMDWYCVYAAVPPERRQETVLGGVKYDNFFFRFEVSVEDVTRAVKHALHGSEQIG
jgi:capsular polysaccharide biosynthesis protein